MDPACISAHASRITVMFNAVPVRPQNESFTGEIICQGMLHSFWGIFHIK
ncbi:MAG: hypothetical protein ACQEWW_15725 [Bacillota bacterium]